MLLKKLVIIFVVFCVIYFWFVLLCLLVILLIRFRVSKFLIRLMVVRIMVQGRMIWKVFQFSGIIGMWNSGRLFLIEVMLFICGMFRFSVMIRIVIMLIFVKGVGMILVMCGMIQMIVMVNVIRFSIVMSCGFVSYLLLLVLWFVFLIDSGILNCVNCVRKIIIVRLFIKFSIIGWGIS